MTSAQTILVGPKDLLPGDVIVGLQRLGPTDDVARRDNNIVAAQVGQHPVAGGECIRLHRKPNHPPTYDFNMWKGHEYFDNSVFHIHRSKEGTQP